jgi:predicted dehydrogenase
VNVAIIGCGLIGQKRLRALKEEHRITVVSDLQLERAEALARQSPGTAATADWHAAVRQTDVDLVIVATTNDSLAPTTREAVEAGKHVLVEKPAALTPQDLEPIIAAAGRNDVQVQVGFNHRFHPALQKAKEIVDSGVLGPLMFIRGRYGHGGRPGYDREWRAQPAKSGGGELIDQGVHLIDLSRWFLGEFPIVEGHAATYFWDMPVDDNAFLSLRTTKNQTAWLQVSCTEWKNMFSFEIYGRTGKLQVDGLGGSYGVERLSFYRMLPRMGPPETTIWEYPAEDVSWKLEISTFLKSIESGKTLGPGLVDARATLEVVQKIYARGRA